MDDPDGVSQQAHIYTFDYERTLNHFINWGKERGDMRISVIPRSQVQWSLQSIDTYVSSYSIIHSDMPYVDSR